jgi:hypothetical protein
VTLRDYFDWHHDYGRPGSPLHLRLLVVQDLLAQALDSLHEGPLGLISMCAGQGRDVLTVAARHRRGMDLSGRLVELDERNVAIARETAEAAGLDEIAVVQSDAGRSNAYAGAAPADVVLVCGVFGNITTVDMERTVRFLPHLCAAGAWVIWTRHPREPGVIERIEQWLAEAGFVRESLVISDACSFGVGAHRFVGEPQPFAAGAELFDFVR